MENSANSAVDGNTKLSTAKKQPSPYLWWTFTLNNWTQKEYDELKSAFSAKNIDLWIIGKEIGENGTPHLQGYFEFKIRARPTSLNLSHNRCHFERRAKKATRLDNYLYCSKDGNFEDNFPRNWKLENNVAEHRGLIKYEQLYWWQKWLVYEYLKSRTEYEDRLIYWIWSEKGNMGKTSFCRYMKRTYKAGYLCNAKSADVALYVFKKGGKDCYCFNYLRSSNGRINYGAIEALKDGLMFSPKYESDDIDIESPFIICMSNEPPEVERLSEDRWVIINIDVDLESECYNDSYIDRINKRLI